MISIDATFPGGRIEYPRSLADRVELEIAADSASPFRQWFAFTVTSTEQAEIALVNASDASFAGAWSGYRAMAMTQPGRWLHVPTRFEEPRLVIEHRPSPRPTRYAYFATYSARRLRSVLDRIGRAAWFDVSTIGESAMGRRLVVASAGAGPRVIWILARQHPGETPASFAAEGLLRRLASPDDEAVETLLSHATVHVVPLMNPDGAELGNMRTSATGSDLNRAWDSPEESDAPEVEHVLEAIGATGVDLFIDVHADESSPHAFAACSEGNPNYDDYIMETEELLRSSLAESNPAFVDDPFYGLDAPGEADLSCASGQVGARYDCPSVTLELPIKDVGDARVLPGWGPERALDFGGRLVDTLARLAPRLRR